MKVMVLATGGTIAGVGSAGENLGYQSGQLPIEDLLESIEPIDSSVEVLSKQICNVNSDDMTSSLWISLANEINQLELDSSIKGIVVTHGTDTMEETAFFINGTAQGTKPVIFTGAMRPATAKDPDGPKNLADSIKLAAKLSLEKAKVLVCFGGLVYDSFNVQKLSTCKLNPMGVSYAGEKSVGSVCDKDINEKIRALPNYFKEPFSILQKELPQVNVVYFAIDSSPEILEYTAKISDGIVIAGAGSGEFSLKFAECLKQIKIPVVVASRIGQGFVNLNKNLIPQGISAGILPPQKAAVLLRLCLTKTKNPKEINRIFENFYP